MAAGRWLRVIGTAALLGALTARAEDKAAAAVPVRAAATTAPAAPKTAAANLGGVTVEGKRNPLDESDKRLRALQQSLPGTEEGPKKGFLDWYEAHNDPNKLKEPQKKMLQTMMGREPADGAAEAQLQRP